MDKIIQIKFEASELDEGEIWSSPVALPAQQRTHECTASGDTANSLQDELQLTCYEYDELQSRHERLADRYLKLQTLCATFASIIGGFFSCEEESPSLDQLRIEAGSEGLRAKALQADELNPMIQEAGGPQALISQVQSLRSLVDKAGGLTELEKLVSELDLFRASLSEVGGLSGLPNLVTEVKKLREQQATRVAANIKMRGPDGPLAKAAKYDKLVKAFDEILAAREPSTETAAINPGRANRVTSTETAGLNPARANLIASTPLENDPYRDLYEAPPAEEPQSKTGANKIPLGPARIRGQLTGQTHVYPYLRREAPNELQGIPSKRPRLDPGFASALVGSTTPLPVERPPQERYMEPLEHGRELFQSNTSVTLEELCSNEEQRLPPKGRRSAPLSAITVTTEYTPSLKSVLMDGYPIALWIGAGDSHGPYLPGKMKSAEKIPVELGEFLVNELSKWITKEVVHLWHIMPPNRDTCVLRYVLDGHRPSGQPQERRACRVCSAAWAGRHRPCAQLVDVEGTRTVVFLPLREEHRKRMGWREKKYWMMETE